jgi:hypothetical protein
MTGNTLWAEQVESQLQPGVHYKQAELLVFSKLVTRMREDGLSMEAIRRHFETTFDIKYGTFYRRLKKAGEGRVI